MKDYDMSIYLCPTCEKIRLTKDLLHAKGNTLIFLCSDCFTEFTREELRLAIREANRKKEGVA